MKFNKNTHFYIAKNIMNSAFSQNQPIDYEKWVEFIDNHPEHFIWKENTKDGIESLANINNVPANFRERILASLNKGACFKGFDKEKGYYNINVGFNKIDNWISIGFERTPNFEDLKIFAEMAKYLDALLLKDGKEIIDEKVIGSH